MGASASAKNSQQSVIAADRRRVERLFDDVVNDRIPNLPQAVVSRFRRSSLAPTMQQRVDAAVNGEELAGSYVSAQWLRAVGIARDPNELQQGDDGAKVGK